LPTDCCPEGIKAECFFQKHLGGFKIPGIEVAMIEESTGRNPYIVANTVEALVGLAQMNALELHTWGATAAATERPDLLVLDLDPDPSLPWERLADAAHAARSLLDTLDIVSFVKTTGGKGLHVVVPLQRRHAWDEIREFARDIAMHFARTSPDQFTATSGEKNRRGKIFVDYLRNARGATAVTPYSLRARPGARVATPLAWDEVSPKLPPGSFTIETIPQRVARRKDPWASYGEHRQRLTAKMLSALRTRSR
jgi:bifunctional non-homologous end joining protein LigD